VSDSCIRGAGLACTVGLAGRVRGRGIGRGGSCNRGAGLAYAVPWQVVRVAGVSPWSTAVSGRGPCACRGWRVVRVVGASRMPRPGGSFAWPGCRRGRRLHPGAGLARAVGLAGRARGRGIGRGGSCNRGAGLAYAVPWRVVRVAGRHSGRRLHPGVGLVCAVGLVGRVRGRGIGGGGGCNRGAGLAYAVPWQVIRVAGVSQWSAAASGRGPCVRRGPGGSRAWPGCRSGRQLHLGAGLART